MKTATMTSSNEQSTREILYMFGNFQTEDSELRDIYDMFATFAYNLWLEVMDYDTAMYSLTKLLKVRDLCLGVSSK